MMTGRNGADISPPLASPSWEILMSHRHKGLLYALLKGGVKLEEIKRWKIGEIAGKVGKNAA